MLLFLANYGILRKNVSDLDTGGRQVMFCKKCGEQIPDIAKFCPCCGATQVSTKYCQHCGEVINSDWNVCPSCGNQVGELKQVQPIQPAPTVQQVSQSQPAPQPIIINNTNTATATSVVNVYGGKPKNKWVAVLLCFFLGFLGAHKFYEGKIGMGILYIFTMGLFGIGTLIDFIRLLFKPNPYYV